MSRINPYVYFLRPVGAEGPVKIGSSVRPRMRLEVYAQLCPFPIEVAATIPGDFDAEARFHAKFAASHTHHEWFTASDELTQTIAAINAGTFRIETLPERGVTITARTRQPWSENSRRGARISHGLRHLEARGIKVPRRVKDAAQRFSWGRTPKYDPKDAAFVEYFIARHRECTAVTRRAA